MRTSAAQALPPRAVHGRGADGHQVGQIVCSVLGYVGRCSLSKGTSIYVAALTIAPGRSGPHGEGACFPDIPSSAFGRPPGTDARPTVGARGTVAGVHSTKCSYAWHRRQGAEVVSSSTSTSWVIAAAE